MSNRVIETLAAAQRFSASHPELHAEWERIRAAGEWIPAPGTPLGDYCRTLSRLSEIAAESCWR